MNFSIKIYFHLAILLVLISLVYGATRYDSWPQIFSAAFRWGLNMVFFLGSVYVVMAGVGWYLQN